MELTWPPQAARVAESVWQMCLAPKGSSTQVGLGDSVSNTPSVPDTGTGPSELPFAPLHRQHPSLTTQRLHLAKGNSASRGARNSQPFASVSPPHTVKEKSTNPTQTKVGFSKQSFPQDRAPHICMRERKHILKLPKNLFLNAAPRL